MSNHFHDTVPPKAAWVPKTQDKVGIVVTCSHEPYAWLAQAIESVSAQTHETRAIVVADGPLLAQDDSSKFTRALYGADWINSLAPHGDAGDWARSTGALHAATLGYDAVGFLDGDNWLEPDHVERALALNVDVATTARFICHTDSRVLGEDRECDGVKHVDTGCFLFRRPAFGLLAHWALIPPAISPICDRVFWSYATAAIGAGRLTHAHSAKPTVNFRSRYAAHYLEAGLEPPPGSKPSTQLPPGVYRLPWPFEQAVTIPET